MVIFIDVCVSREKERVMIAPVQRLTYTDLAVAVAQPRGVTGASRTEFVVGIVEDVRVSSASDTASQ
jgi:hypothetical protein